MHGTGNSHSLYTGGKAQDPENEHNQEVKYTFDENTGKHIERRIWPCMADSTDRGTGLPGTIWQGVEEAGSHYHGS